ncbi:MAG: hypothetical protein M1839_005743 [Geoglossum umbratile]|nr:MAG: hypothetical protein M1839_005743 [Geoglossum umbratile]
MPPPIDIDSDESNESLDEIPARNSSRKGRPPVEVDGDDDEEGEEEEEDAEEVDGEYVVEAIVDHMFDEEGTIRLQVKWKGYDRPKDMTWEPETNLAEDVSDMLEEYYQKIGGRPKLSKKAISGKRARDNKSNTPQSSRKGSKSRKTNDYGSTRLGSASPPTKVERDHWEPPKGSWENDVQTVDTIEQDRRGLQVYLQWNNGHKSTHAIDIAKKKCPMKLLDFYEQHLVFKQGGAIDNSS